MLVVNHFLPKGIFLLSASYIVDGATSTSCIHSFAVLQGPPLSPTLCAGLYSNPILFYLGP